MQPETWIGDLFTSDIGWTHLEELVDIGNRMAGSEGERTAAVTTRDALADAGCRNVRLESFGIQGWQRGESSVIAAETDTELDCDCIALPRSPSTTATGRLVDLGYGLPTDFEAADLEGAIVLVRSDVPSYVDRYIHRREKYYRAVEAGAAAFVYRNHVEGCLPPTGSVGTEAAPIGEIPAVGVSAEGGARLARRFEEAELSVAVTAEIGEATSQNVHAECGPDTDDRVLITSHVDAHDIAEGAVDNAAGTAMVVELAHALVAREDALDTRVEFIAYGAEEVGLVGSSHHAETTTHKDIVAILNNDGVVGARTLSLSTHGFGALEAAADRIADQFGHPIETVPRLSPHSDHWPFSMWGVPAYHARSTSDSVGRGWGHTHADTVEKLERRTFREQAILLGSLAVELAADRFEVTHKTPAAVAATLEDEGLAAGMKYTDDWPYDG